MQTRHLNPYEGPSTEEARLRPVRLRWLRLAWQVGANLVTLTAILLSRVSLQHRFTIMELELPFLTRLAMGPLLPVAIGVLLVISVVIHIRTSDRLLAFWESIFIILLGFFTGFYIIACGLVFVTVTTELSSCADVLPKPINLW